MKLIRLIDVAPQPWRNGGGVTRELLAWPPGNDWQFRISVADIESDGPFSVYPDVERWFTVLKGAGVELSIAGAKHRLVRGNAPLRFGGDAAVACRLLDGPTQDLNLMLRRAAGKLQNAVDGQVWTPTGAQCGLFSAVSGRCTAGTGTGRNPGMSVLTPEATFDIAVPAYALLWFDSAPTSLVFSASQRPAALIGWWLSATPKEG